MIEGHAASTPALYRVAALLKMQQNLIDSLLDQVVELRLKSGGPAPAASPSIPDAVETSDAGLQQDLGLALIEMSAEALRRSDDAVAQLASGAYGCCAECSGEISQKRPEALSFAVGCRECEEVYEISARRSRRLAHRRTGSLGWIDSNSRD